MLRKSMVTVLVLFLGGLYPVGSFLAAEEKVEEVKIVNKMVTISYEGLRPARLTSTPGTTVVWVNNSRFPIEILFPDKKVVLACGAPVNFFVDSHGNYESNKIPSGGTASLCFLEKGTYEYRISASTTFYTGRIQRERKGTIVIE